MIDGIHVGHVDCDSEGTEETCKARGKKKLPALIIWTPDSGDGPATKSKVYPADHADSVFDIAVKNIPSVALVVPPDGLQQFLSLCPFLILCSCDCTRKFIQTNSHHGLHIHVNSASQ